MNVTSYLHWISQLLALVIEMAKGSTDPASSSIVQCFHTYDQLTNTGSIVFAFDLDLDSDLSPQHSL